MKLHFLLAGLFLSLLCLGKPNESKESLSPEVALSEAFISTGLDSIIHSEDSVAIRHTSISYEEFSATIYDFRYSKDNSSAIIYRLSVDSLSRNTFLFFFRPRKYFTPIVSKSEMQAYTPTSILIEDLPQIKDISEENCQSPETTTEVKISDLYSIYKYCGGNNESIGSGYTSFFETNFFFEL